MNHQWRWRYLHLYWLGLILWWWSCQGKEPPGTAALVNKEPVKEHYLRDEYTRLFLPLRYVPSSRYRAEKDLTNFYQDSAALKVLQNSLANLEFTDREIDFFADTSNFFDHILIIDFDYTPLDIKSGRALKGLMRRKFEELEANFPELDIRSTEAVLRQYAGNHYFKFKNAFENTMSGTGYFFNTYFITTPKKTYYVQEICSSEKDNELWLSGIKY